MTDLADLAVRVWSDLLARPSGPLGFRLILQPRMAVLIAMREGAQDARSGWPPYRWALVSGPGNRAERLRQGRKAVSRVIALAFLPYALARGPAERIARGWDVRR